MPNKLETKNISFVVKSFDEGKGTFEGYGSIFGNEDSYGDIVKKGAFVDSLKKRKPKLLWQHRMSEPIGIYEEIREDEKGLFVKGKLEMESDFGKRIHSLLKMGALEGLSIGYRTVKCEFEDKERIRILTKLDLFEISIVTMPANEDALIDYVKSDEKEIEQFDCMKDFENFLKEPYGLKTREERATFISKLKEFSNKRDVEEQTAKKRDAEAKNQDFVLKSLNNVINQIKGKNA